MNKPNPTAAFLVIGDEILSGRTKDANINFLATELVAIGIDLKEVRIVPDEKLSIVANLNHFRNNLDLVFTSGGIGPTHDDLTAEAVAEAFGLQLEINQKAKEIIQSRAQNQGLEFNEARMRMARIPPGAKLIDNPVSGAPGFVIENVYVLAGVPRIFRAMVGNVIKELPHGKKLLSKTVKVHQPEGEIAGKLSIIASENPEVSIGSYPFFEEGKLGANVVVRGKNIDLVNSVETTLKKVFMVNH